MPSKTYERLLLDSPEMSLVRYGRSHALGMKGPRHLIDKAHNLFVNYDRVCTLHRLSDELSYILTTPERVRASIKLYLYVNLLHSREVGSYSTWDEDTEKYAIVAEEAKAENISSHDASLFMEHIKLRFKFMPSDRATGAEALAYA